IEATQGSVVSSDDGFDSSGGIFSATDHSTMLLAGNHGGSRFVTDATSHIDLYSNGDHGSLTDVTFDGNISFMGNTSGTITNLGSAVGEIDPSAPTSFDNHGSFTFEPQGVSGGPPLTFTGGGQVTLAGLNVPGSPDFSSPILNVDNTMTGTGVFSQLRKNGG